MAWYRKPFKDFGGGAKGSARGEGPEKFVLSNGIALSVQSGDITKMAGDVVVVGEDDDFSGKGAVAKALIRAGGEVYRTGRDALKRQIQKEGCEHRVYRCFAGPALQFFEVFHAITLYRGHTIPFWSTHLENLFHSIGVTAEEILHKNVFTPLLGAGNAGGTVDVSLQAAVNGLSKLTPKSLKEVIIVEYDRNKAAEIRGKLKQILSQDQQRGQGQLQESGRGAGGEFPGSPIRPAQGTSAEGRTLLSVARGRGSGSGGDPMNQGALGGTGHGNMGQGGGRGEGRGAGQPTSHQRTPTSSAQQQSGNHQNILADIFQPTLVSVDDDHEWGEFAASRNNQNTAVENTDASSGAPNHFDTQNMSRQGGRGRGRYIQSNYKEGSPVDRPTGGDPRPEKNPDLLNKEKDKKEKQMKERDPRSKEASGSKGPKHSSNGLAQGAVAQEPDMTGAAFIGNMPDGKMVVSKKPRLQLDGHPDCGTILIEYSFPNGTQGPQHPAPGQPYKGTFRRAYLPDNQEGRRVLELLEKAFKRKLTFHLERSGPNEEWVVEFDDIPHKTSLKGGKKGSGYPDPDYLADVLAVLSDYGLREKPVEISKTDENQLETTHTTEQGGELGPQQNVHSKMRTSSGTITAATNTILTSSNLEEDPSSPSSSSPLNARKEALKQRCSSKNATLKSPQTSKEEAGKPQADRSTPETSSMKKSDDPESKGTANVPGEVEPHRETPADSNATPKAGPEDLAISKRGSTTSGQMKKQTHTDAPTEPSSASTRDESHEESTSPESKDSTNGERNSDTPTKPRTDRTPDENPDAPTNPDSEVNTSGQKNGESDTEPRVTPSPAESQVQSSSPENEYTTNGQDRDTGTGPRTANTSGENPEKSINPESEVIASGQKNGESDIEPRITSSSAEIQVQSTSPENEGATNGQDRDTETGPRTARTSDENPEKSIKQESEIDTRRHKNEERDVDSTTEARASSTPEKAPEKSTNSDVKISTSGQRKSKTHSDSQPESRPAPTPAGCREEPPTDANVTSISDEDAEKSANPEVGVETSGQNNRENNIGTLTEPRAPVTPAEIPEESPNPEKEDSARGQTNEDLNTPPEPRSSATSVESTDASANPESEESADGQKNEEENQGTPTEPRAASSSEKTPEDSENGISRGGQRKGETQADSPPVSRTTPTPDEDPEASSSSKGKDGMSGQSKRGMDTGPPTDSSSALTLVEDPARSTNPERVTEKVSHFHPAEVEKSHAENEEAEATLNDHEAEVKNQPKEPKPEAGRPREKREKLKKTSSKKTMTDSKIIGNMPPGLMLPITRKRVSVPGYDDCDVIVIDYYFTKGEQGACHPEPGSPYSGCVEYAFLPDNQEGRRVLKLLQEAFKRRLTFQLVQTGPNGEWGVEFADIPHKTSLKGGPERGGYPDPGYLEHVQSMLRDKYGIE